MSKDAQTILAFLLGWSIFVGTMQYMSNAESAQKIENIEKLYKAKEYLKEEKSIQETGLEMQKVQVLIDSLNNIK